MSGRPMMRRIERTVAEKGGDEWVWTMIADGKAMSEVAEAMGCSRPYVYMWMDAKEGRRAAYEDAKVLSAVAKEEEGQAILDDLAGEPDLSAPAVSLALARSNYRKWQATLRDRATYADKPAAGLELTLNVGALHLDALRMRGPAPRELAPVEVVEAEVVE